MKIRALQLFFLTLLTASTGHVAIGQSLTPSDAKSTVQFKIKNFGSTVDGTFKGLKGTIDFDPLHPSMARFDVSVDANSIDTFIGLRNKHLKKEDYFDVVTYPRIRFVSTSISASSENGSFVFKGNLTIKATTKEITFPFTYDLVNGAPVFRGEFSLNRRDFKVGGNSFSLADTLVVFLSISTDK